MQPDSRGRGVQYKSVYCREIQDCVHISDYCCCSCLTVWNSPFSRSNWAQCNLPAPPCTIVAAFMLRQLRNTGGYCQLLGGFPCRGLHHMVGVPNQVCTRIRLPGEDYTRLNLPGNEVSQTQTLSFSSSSSVRSFLPVREWQWQVDICVHRQSDKILGQVCLHFCLSYSATETEKWEEWDVCEEEELDGQAATSLPAVLCSAASFSWCTVSSDWCRSFSAHVGELSLRWCKRHNYVVLWAVGTAVVPLMRRCCWCWPFLDQICQRLHSHRCFMRTFKLAKCIQQQILGNGNGTIFPISMLIEILDSLFSCW